MKVPHFEKLNPTTYEKENLLLLFKDKYGSSPLYFDLTELEYNEASIAVNNIEVAIDMIKGNVLFPYPIYIVTTHNLPLTHIEAVNTVEQLPQYFSKKQSRLKAKEVQMLKKTILISKKIKNLSIEDIRNDLAPAITSHRGLYILAKENTFYEGLIEKLSLKKEDN